MYPGIGLPAAALVATVLTIAVDVRRSQAALLRRLGPERLARYGRLVMNPQRMVVAWSMLALAIVCALFHAVAGSPAWWVWLAVAAAQAGDIGARMRSRVLFLSFMAGQGDGRAHQQGHVSP